MTRVYWIFVVAMTTLCLQATGNTVALEKKIEMFEKQLKSCDTRLNNYEKRAKDHETRLDSYSHQTGES